MSYQENKNLPEGTCGNMQQSNRVQPPAAEMLMVAEQAKKSR